MRSLHLALADLEQQQYVTRDSHCRCSIALTTKGIALAQRWHLFIPVAGAEAQTWQALGAPS